MAEREGFEPSVRSSRTRDFQSRTFDHSVTSPRYRRVLAARMLRDVASVSARRHGGGGGIRTHGTREGTTVFETATIDQLRHPTCHSADCPPAAPRPRPRTFSKKARSKAPHSPSMIPDVTATL